MSEGNGQKAIKAASLPPAQPTFILRGHASTINSLHFLRDNLRLLSGDSDGFVVLWNVSIKRPTAVWQAHEGSILGLGSWGDDRIITHGRDSHLRVWKLTEDDELNGGLSKLLPVDGDATVARKQPWLLHALTVSTLNFCSFASCLKVASEGAEVESLLVAVPGVQDSQVQIYDLPSEKQVALVPVPNQAHGKTGMVMALRIFQNAQDRRMHVVVGYENGRVVLFRQAPSMSSWEEVYASTDHNQPILSLDVSEQMSSFFTSGADTVISKHGLDVSASSLTKAAQKAVQTGHSGQQSLTIRRDSRIFATAGWDGRARVYSTKTLKELAVLKWHKDGVYAVAFGSLSPVPDSAKAPTQKTGRVAQAREQKTRETHWLAAGAKDGKISLWDIY